MIRMKPKTAPTVTPASCTAELTTRMAEVMRELAFSGDGATPENLERYGFSNAVVSSLGNRAAALARRLSVRQVANHA